MANLYEDENEQNEDGGLTRKDFEDQACYCIRTFFRNKVDEYGSAIDPEELLNERNICLVLNMSICDHLPVIYKALKSLNKEKKKGKLPDDVQMVLKLFNECAKLSIPKRAETGVVAIYVEVCKGCTVDIDVDDFES